MIPAALRAAGADEFGVPAVLRAVLEQTGTAERAATLLGVNPALLKTWLVQHSIVLVRPVEMP